MSDFEKTRKIGDTPDAIGKTRLVRPAGSSSSPQTERYNPQESAGSVPKTKLFGRPSAQAAEAPAMAQDGRLVTGWLVVVKGPGKGKFAALYDGMNSIGRGEDQASPLNFGDESISRSEYAFVTYDYVDRKFYLNHGGKSNIVRINGRPVLQPIEVQNGDLIEIGATTCRMTQFCGPDFDWQEDK